MTSSMDRPLPIAYSVHRRSAESNLNREKGNLHKFSVTGAVVDRSVVYEIAVNRALTIGEFTLKDHP